MAFLKDLAARHGLKLMGDDNVDVAGIAGLESAGKSDLVLALDEAFLETALQSGAGAVLAGDFAAESAKSKPLLIAQNPKLAFSRIAEDFERAREAMAGVHPNAVVHSSAKIGPGAGIGPNVLIGANVALGAGTRVAAGAVVHGGAKIGQHCRIGSNVVIHGQVTIGDRVVVQAGAVLGSDGFGYVRDPATGAYVRFPQIGRLEIGDDVEIGALCTIDRGALGATVVGQGVKLDNLVHIGHNVRIGKNVVIAAQTGISGSVVIEDDCVIGGQVGIGDHVVIKRGTVLGSAAGVLPHKVLKAGEEPYWGTPAQPLSKHLKELATVRKLAKGVKDEK
jgi:UDP-3-O-[3-hydroxymyristoyl] glucosamine N-acyltransferase